MPLRSHASTIVLVLLALAAASTQAGAQALAQEGGKQMECAVVTTAEAEAETSGLGSPLIIRLDAEARSVALEAPVPGPAAAAESVELAWLGEAGLRAVVVVVTSGVRAGLDGPPPVVVLDLDFSEARLRLGTFGGDAWELEADVLPTQYSCERLN